MTTSLPFTASDLCAHGDALRRLAHALLGDQELAQDAVQEAWLKALAQPPRNRAALPRWLMQVVHRWALDLRRGDRRRVAREAVAARPETTPADAAESLAVQHEILAAVRALREPYRTVVWLRYYEDLAPAAIAARLGEPVKTVKTRLWRALRILREEMDRQEQHRDWRAALLPLAAADPGAPAAVAWAVGVWTMQMTKTALAVAGVLAAAALWVLWSGLGTRGPDPTLTGAGPQAPPTENAPASREDVAASREAIAPPPADPTPNQDPYGSLLIHALWHDETPAADVAFVVVAEGEPVVDRNDLRVVTDARGIARATRLHAGKVKVSSERGGERTVEVTAGLEHEVRFTLPRGVDVEGSVEDASGQGVAGARVWLANGAAARWTGGRVVAVAGKDGRFSVRGVDRGHSLGALAPGFAPSVLVDLADVAMGSDPSPVKVRLLVTRKGAAVTGRVVDAAGAPVAGAWVAVGYTRTLGRGPGHGVEPWTPEVLASAADGGFQCDAVEPGTVPIEVRADGYALWSRELNLAAGATAEVLVTLSRGVTVHGTVTGADGRPAAGAVVMSLHRPLAKATLVVSPAERGDDTRIFQRPRTLANAKGRYRLPCVPTGDAYLLAGKWKGPSCEGMVQATLSARSGHDLVWNPVLSLGLTIRGRVIYADGKPYPLPAILEATPDVPAEGAELLLAFGQRDGSFQFTQCDDVPYTVAPQAITRPRGTGWVYRTGVRPGGEELVLQFPRVVRDRSATVLGRVVDTGRRLRSTSDLRVVISSSAGSYQDALKTGDRFHVEGLQPDRYHLLVRAGDDLIHVGPWFELAPGQRLDVGDLVTAPGATLSVVVRAAPGLDVGMPRGTAICGHEMHDLKWDGHCLRRDNLTAGPCRLLVYSWTEGAWHARPRDLTLAAGEKGEVEVEIAPAAMRTLEITFPLPERWQEGGITLRDAQGALVSECPRVLSSRVGFRPVVWRAGQPPGQYTLEVTVDGRPPRTWPVDLSDPSTAGRVLRFSLR